MAFATRDQLLTLVTLPREIVAAPELGAGVEVIVQGMSGAQRDQWEASLIVGKGRKRDVSTANIRAKLVAQCCVSEDGRRLFSDEDAEELGRIRVDVLNRLWNVAQRLSGVTEEDAEELGKASTTAEPSTLH
jgi:hypothetical protein